MKQDRVILDSEPTTYRIIVPSYSKPYRLCAGGVETFKIYGYSGLPAIIDTTMQDGIDLVIGVNANAIYGRSASVSIGNTLTIDPLAVPPIVEHHLQFEPSMTLQMNTQLSQIVDAGVSTTIEMDASIDAFTGYLAHISEWENYSMADLADMTMREMVYVEVDNDN